MLAAMLMIDTMPMTSPARIEQAVRDRVEHAPLHLRELVDRQCVEEEQVQQEVDRDDRERAERERARNVAPGSCISSATYAAAFHPE